MSLLDQRIKDKCGSDVCGPLYPMCSCRAWAGERQREAQLGELSMTPQEIFDKVAAHLIAQGEPAAAGGACKYRLPLYDGRVLMCAVGCLIPDGLYTFDMERQGIYDLVTNFGKSLPAYFSDNLALLADLQRVHDALSESPTLWPRLVTELNEVAERFELQPCHPAMQVIWLRNEDGVRVSYEVAAHLSPDDAMREAWALYRELPYRDDEMPPQWARR